MNKFELLNNVCFNPDFDSCKNGKITKNRISDTLKAEFSIFSIL